MARNSILAESNDGDEDSFRQKQVKWIKATPAGTAKAYELVKS